MELSPCCFVRNRVSFGWQIWEKISSSTWIIQGRVPFQQNRCTSNFAISSFPQASVTFILIITIIIFHHCHKTCYYMCHLWKVKKFQSKQNLEKTCAVKLSLTDWQQGKGKENLESFNYLGLPQFLKRFQIFFSLSTFSLQP